MASLLESSIDDFGITDEQKVEIKSDIKINQPTEKKFKKEKKSNESKSKTKKHKKHRKHKKHKKSKKHKHQHHKKSAQELVQTKTSQKQKEVIQIIKQVQSKPIKSQKKTLQTKPQKAAQPIKQKRLPIQSKKTKIPQQTTLIKTHSKDNFEKDSKKVIIPLNDDQQYILKVSPTMERDRVGSVQLVNFHQVIGYNTFDQILKKSNDEVDPESDWFNLTVNIMVQRVHPHTNSLVNKGHRLIDSLDKGFPYDDADVSITNTADNFKQKQNNKKQTIGQLNDLKYTKEQIQNLIQDVEPPLTQSLVGFEDVIEEVVQEIKQQQNNEKQKKLSQAKSISKSKKSRIQKLRKFKNKPENKELLQIDFTQENFSSDYQSLDSIFLKNKLQQKVSIVQVSSKCHDITREHVLRYDYCEPVPKGTKKLVNGQWEQVICTLDGVPVTWQNLRNIVNEGCPQISPLIKGFMVQTFNQTQIIKALVCSIMNRIDPETTKAEKICKDIDLNVNGCSFANLNASRAILRKLVQEQASKQRMKINAPSMIESQKGISSTNSTKYVIGGDVCIDPPNATKKMKKGQYDELKGNETVCILDGYNVTKDMLRNLVLDNPSPITLPLPSNANKPTSLVATKRLAFLCTLYKDNNTVAADVCQGVSSVKTDCVLNSLNVTKNMLKNLILDIPSPITISKAQIANKKLQSAISLINQESSQQVNLKIGNKICDPAPRGTYMMVNGKREKVICTMNGFNITVRMLKNLITDTPAPITQPLTVAQKISSLAEHQSNKQSDICTPAPKGTKMMVDGKLETVICTMDGYNVTWRLLKNLITDSPAPITIPLNSFFQKYSQVSEHIMTVKLGSDVCEPVQKGTKTFVNGKWEEVICTLNGFNVTVSQLKHLITDTPAPITLPLNSTAQKQDPFGKPVSLVVGDTECKPVAKGTKVQVNGKWEEVVCTMDGQNVTWSQLKNLITDTPAPITLPLNSKAQLSKDFNEVWEALGNDLCVEVPRKKLKRGEWDILEGNQVYCTLFEYNLIQKIVRRLSRMPWMDFHKWWNSPQGPDRYVVGPFEACNGAGLSMSNCTLRGFNLNREATEYLLGLKKLPSLTQTTSIQTKSVKIGGHDCTLTPKGTKVNVGGKQEDVICQMDGFNVTSRALKNLLLDIPAPIVLPLNSFLQELSHQNAKSIEIKIGSDVCEPVPKGTKMVVNGKEEIVVCKLDGFNVTWSQLKNLITDAPSPITLPLNSRTQISRQKSFDEIMDELGNGMCVLVPRPKPKPGQWDILEGNQTYCNLLNYNLVRRIVRNLLRRPWMEFHKWWNNPTAGDKYTIDTYEVCNGAGRSMNNCTLEPINMNREAVNILIKEDSKRSFIQTSLVQQLNQALAQVSSVGNVCDPAAKGTKMNVGGKQEDVICTLDGFNVTKNALKNLLLDIPAPITRPLNSLFQKLVQSQVNQLKLSIGSEICEPVPRGTKTFVNGKYEQVICTMNGFNVTVSQLKHLITDTPAPITLPLNSTAQREGRGELSGKEIHVTIGDTECKPVSKGTKVLINGKLEEIACTLNGLNVTWTHLKNLILDVEPPITSSLYQKTLIEYNSFVQIDEPSFVIPRKLWCEAHGQAESSCSLSALNVTSDILTRIITDTPTAITVPLDK